MAMYLVQGVKRAVAPSSGGVMLATTTTTTSPSTATVEPPARTSYNVTAAKLAGKWECKGCQHINKDSFSRCWACGTFRSIATGGMYMCQGEGCSAVNTRMSGSCSVCTAPFTGVSNWVCTACSHENTRKDLSCLNCKTAQPLSWTCSSCGCDTTSTFADSCRQCKEPRPVPKVTVSLPVCLNCGTKNHKSAMRCTVCLATNSPTTFGPEGSYKGVVVKESTPVKDDLPRPEQPKSTITVRAADTLPPETTAPEPQQPVKPTPPLPPAKPKPLPPSKPSSLSTKYKWKCKHCSHESDETTTRCSRCGKPHHPPVFKALVGNKWQCRGCNTTLPSRVSTCATCKMDRVKSDLICGCSFCEASRQPLGEPCGACKREVAPSYNCSRCARLTPLNKEMQCVWCSYVSGPSPKTLCTVCGDESSYVRCTTCAKYSSSHKWVCTCMSIIPTTITSCEICDGPMDKAILKVPSTWKCEGCSYVWSSEQPQCRNTKCSKEGGGAYGRSFPHPIKCHECNKMTKWDSSGECQHCSMNLWPRGGKTSIVRMPGAVERQSGVVVVGTDESALNSFLQDDEEVTTSANTKHHSPSTNDESVLAEIAADDAPRDATRVSVNHDASKNDSSPKAPPSPSSPAKTPKATSHKKSAKGKLKKRSPSTVADAPGTTCGLCGHHNQSNGGDCAKCGLPL